MRQRNVVVIGGGPGGYVAAIRAAQLGARVTLVEKDKLGGTCLNVGCIPTKVLLHTAELFNELDHVKELGIDVKNPRVDWKTLMKRKERIVAQLTGGVKGLLVSNGIEIVKGTASFRSSGEIGVDWADGNTMNIEADSFIIATGSVPFVPPVPGTHLPGVITSSEALSLDVVPKSMVIIGGGVIGVEFASIYSSLGCSVTIIEMMDQILPNMEEELADILKGSLLSRGVKVNTQAKVTSINKDGIGLQVRFEEKGAEKAVSAEKVVVAVGRRPNTAGLNLEAAGVRLNKDRIIVNDRMKTAAENIYAVGDCTGKMMLAHAAFVQGVAAAENIMGKDTKMDYKTVPSCVYTQPELASVGMTEKLALERGHDIKVGRFPLMANAKSLIMNQTGGMVKVISDKKYDEVLGVHILGPRATDLITQGALALRLEATLEEIISTVHAHPTVGEALQEAALAADGAAIHLPGTRG